MRKKIKEFVKSKIRSILGLDEVLSQLPYIIKQNELLQETNNSLILKIEVLSQLPYIIKQNELLQETNNSLMLKIQEQHELVLHSFQLINKLNEVSEYYRTRQFAHIHEYLESEKYKLSRQESLSKKYIFITARFRTGSTYLYDLFSCLENSKAFYEPLNPLLPWWIEQDEQRAQQDKQLLGHTLNQGYWEGYKSINLQNFKAVHKVCFAKEKLILSSDDCFYDLKQYIDFLVQASGEKLSIFQFNRVDFRLPWIKCNFPNALIVNLRRNPRDIYASYSKIFDKQNKNDSHTTRNMGNLFSLDEYIYTLGRFINPHFTTNQLNDYEKIYLLNRLSNIWSDSFADIIIDYEALVENPIPTVQKVLDKIGAFDTRFAKEPTKASSHGINVWKNYKSEEWFVDCEQKCNTIIDQMLV